MERRFYAPVKAEYQIKENGWTLGSIKHIYGTKKSDWETFKNRAKAFQITEEVLTKRFVEQMVVEQISELRNKLAHGEQIDKATASRLRDAILGVRRQDGLLTWVVRNIGPEVNKVAQ